MVSEHALRHNLGRSGNRITQTNYKKVRQTMAGDKWLVDQIVQIDGTWQAAEPCGDTDIMDWCSMALQRLEASATDEDMQEVYTRELGRDEALGHDGSRH
jgi:hypothetical protein